MSGYSTARIKELLADSGKAYLEVGHNERLTRERVSRLELVVIELLKRVELLEVYGRGVCGKCKDYLPSVRDEAGNVRLDACSKCAYEATLEAKKEAINAS